MSWVYFITAREVGRVKIGHSLHPQARLSALRSSSPVELHLEALGEGSPEDEADLHDRFAPHRFHGEWFQLTPEIESVIAGLGVSETPRRTSNFAGRDALTRWLHSNRVKQCDFAMRCGVSSTTIANIRFGRRKVKPPLARKIEAETGGHVTAADLAAMRKNAA